MSTKPNMSSLASLMTAAVMDQNRSSSGERSFHVRSSMNHNIGKSDERSFHGRTSINHYSSFLEKQKQESDQQQQGPKYRRRTMSPSGRKEKHEDTVRNTKEKSSELQQYQKQRQQQQQNHECPDSERSNRSTRSVRLYALNDSKTLLALSSLAPPTILASSTSLQIGRNVASSSKNNNNKKDSDAGTSVPVPGRKPVARSKSFDSDNHKKISMFAVVQQSNHNNIESSSELSVSSYHAPTRSLHSKNDPSVTGSNTSPQKKSHKQEQQLSATNMIYFQDNDDDDDPSFELEVESDDDADDFESSFYREDDYDDNLNESCALMNSDDDMDMNTNDHDDILASTNNIDENGSEFQVIPKSTSQKKIKATSTEINSKNARKNLSAMNDDSKKANKNKINKSKSTSTTSTTTTSKQSKTTNTSNSSSTSSSNVNISYSKSKIQRGRSKSSACIQKNDVVSKHKGTGDVERRGRSKSTEPQDVNKIDEQEKDNTNTKNKVSSSRRGRSKSIDKHDENDETKPTTRNVKGDGKSTIRRARSKSIERIHGDNDNDDTMKMKSSLHNSCSNLDVDYGSSDGRRSGGRRTTSCDDSLRATTTQDETISRNKVVDVNNTNEVNRRDSLSNLYKYIKNIDSSINNMNTNSNGDSTALTTEKGVTGSNDKTNNSTRNDRTISKSKDPSQISKQTTSNRGNDPSKRMARSIVMRSPTPSSSTTSKQMSRSLRVRSSSPSSSKRESSKLGDQVPTISPKNNDEADKPNSNNDGNTNIDLQSRGATASSRLRRKSMDNGEITSNSEKDSQNGRVALHRSSIGSSSVVPSTPSRRGRRTVQQVVSATKHGLLGDSGDDHDDNSLCNLMNYISKEDKHTSAVTPSQDAIPSTPSRERKMTAKAAKDLVPLSVADYFSQKEDVAPTSSTTLHKDDDCLKLSVQSTWNRNNTIDESQSERPTRSLVAVESFADFDSNNNFEKTPALEKRIARARDKSMELDPLCSSSDHKSRSNKEGSTDSIKVTAEQPLHSPSMHTSSKRSMQRDESNLEFESRSDLQPVKSSSGSQINEFPETAPRRISAFHPFDSIESFDSVEFGVLDSKNIKDSTLTRGKSDQPLPKSWDNNEWFSSNNTKKDSPKGNITNNAFCNNTNDFTGFDDPNATTEKPTMQISSNETTKSKRSNSSQMDTTGFKLMAALESESTNNDKKQGRARRSGNDTVTTATSSTSETVSMVAESMDEISENINEQSTTSTEKIGSSSSTQAVVVSRESFFEMINMNPFHDNTSKLSNDTCELLIKTMNDNPNLCKEKYPFQSSLDSEAVYPVHILSGLGLPVACIRQCVKAYPKAFRDISSKIGSPLHYAVSFLDLNRTVINNDEYENDVNNKSSSGKMQGADHFTVVKFLSKVSTKDILRCQNKMDRKTPLHIFVTKSVIPKSRITSIGAQSESTATEKKAMAVVDMLAKDVPEVFSMKDNNGNTPLHSACSMTPYSSPVILERLLSLTQKHPSACIVQDNDGATPLHVALSCRAPVTVVQRLIRANEKALRIKDKKRRIPLHVAIAVQIDDITIYHALIATYPESLKVPNKHGERPQRFAKVMKLDDEIIKLLTCS